VAHLFKRYSGKLPSKIPCPQRQTTVIPVCGTKLQILLSIVLSCYHSRILAPHDAIVVIVSAGAALQIDAGWTARHFFLFKGPRPIKI
jgi:hypothetical protein